MVLGWVGSDVCGGDEKGNEGGSKRRKSKDEHEAGYLDDVFSL